MAESTILALDVATRTGWSMNIASGKNPWTCGCWDLSPKRDESAGMRVIRFKAKLKTILEAGKIDLVVFERPGGMHKGAIIVQAELQGVLKLFCEEEGIPYKAYSSQEIKKYGTGKGNAGKPLMIEHAKLKYGYEGDSDDEADSLHLLHLAKDDLKL